MTHPITPPLELIQQFWEKAEKEHEDNWDVHAAVSAARWGADVQLGAVCEWLRSAGIEQGFIDELRAACRPKPPSLKEQALETLSRISKDGYPCNYQDDKDWETIRRALEQLDD